MAENEVIALSETSQEAQAVVKDTLLGPGMRRLQLQRQSAYLDLKNSGRLRPATVINFNPVSLKVEDGNVPWRVPAATDALKKGIKVTHGGREYEASVLTVREPAFVPWIRDVRKPSDEGEHASAEYDAKFILPIELVDQFRLNYTDSSRTLMGGLLVFEGDIHAFTKSKTIRIPKYTLLPDRTRSYYSEEVDTAKHLAAMLTLQKNFCQFSIQQADEYYQDEVNAKNITSVHRVWAQFALDKGWKQQTPPWMNATLDSEEACKGCGKGKKRNDAWFCECGRPYNPYAAFMAGENVPESYLFALDGKELDNVLKELARREGLRAKFRISAEPDSKK